IMPFSATATGKLTSVSLIFDGLADAVRQKVFSGFNAGDIQGNFGTNEIFPEWWGLEDNHHDRAINCAIRAGGLHRGMSRPGNLVSLAAGNYNISAPLDLTSSLSLLQGAGDGRTSIMSTSSWFDPDPETVTLWAQGPNLTLHSAMVWIGGARGPEADS